MPHSLTDLLVHVVFSTKGRALVRGGRRTPVALRAPSVRSPPRTKSVTYVPVCSTEAVEIVAAPDGAGFGMRSAVVSPFQGFPELLLLPTAEAVG